MKPSRIRGMTTSFQTCRSMTPRFAPAACIAGISRSGFIRFILDAGIENEADEPVKVEVVRRHARDHDARGAFGGAVSPGMADGAVEPDEIDASEITLRNANGQVLLPSARVRVVEKAKGPV